jgi:hypothetical protein
MPIQTDEVDVEAAARFGRDITQFHGLLAFMTVLSLVLWSLVLVTTVIRFGVKYAMRHHARPSAGPLRQPTGRHRAVFIDNHVLQPLSTPIPVPRQEFHVTVEELLQDPQSSDMTTRVQTPAETPAPVRGGRG